MKGFAKKVINHIMSTKSPAYLGNNRAIIKTVHRIKLIVDTRDISIAPHILVDRQWEPSTTKFFRRKIKPGHKIAEVGANIGYYTTIAAKIVGKEGRVFAFEANPEIYEICKTNIEINGFDKIAHVRNIAITKERGVISFQKFSRHQGNSTIVQREALEEYCDEIESIQINTISLDEALDSERLDFIKIDAEGSEGLIFSGMSNLIKNNAPKILLEFFPVRLSQAGTNPSELLDYLLNAGFTLNVVDDDSVATKRDRSYILNKDISELYLVK